MQLIALSDYSREFINIYIYSVKEKLDHTFRCILSCAALSQMAPYDVVGVREKRGRNIYILTLTKIATK